MLTDLPLGDRLRFDLRDVTLWLRTQYPRRPVHMVIDLNYSAAPGVLSHVVIFEEDRDTRRLIRASATQALEALGYKLAPTGGDVYDAGPFPHGHLSAHQVLRCVRRVRRAFAGEYTQPYDFDRTEPEPFRVVDSNF